jgi:hypothetical protein
MLKANRFQRGFYAFCASGVCHQQSKPAGSVVGRQASVPLAQRKISSPPLTVLWRQPFIPTNLLTRLNLAILCFSAAW